MALQHSFSGKRVLITGGAQGIGRQLVQRFHDDGATVFAIDKNSEKIQELRKALPKVTAEVVNLGDWDATKKLVESFGLIDHLVNNASALVLQDFLDITKEAASTQFNVNLGAIMNVSQVVSKRLIAEGRGGSIVNISSISSQRGSPVGGIVYAATKAGLENLTKSMAVGLGQHDIRVNAVSPGWVSTGLLSSAGVSTEKQEEMLEFFKQRLVIKRVVELNEIADLVMFLLSPLSSMIVGENIDIDGGYMKSY